MLSKLKSRVAFGVARKFLNKIIAEKQMIIKNYFNYNCHSFKTQQINYYVKTMT